MSSSHPSPERAARDAAGSLRLLLVSGPSGAGKSTFIDLMQSGALPPEIAAQLPEGCARWPVYAANDFRKHGIDPDAMLRDAQLEAGVILHYDIVFPHRYGIHDYEKDPAARVFARSRAPVIVSVKLPRQRLISQFESRLDQHMRKKSMARRLWRQLVHRPMRRVMARLRGDVPRETTDLYSDPAWLAGCCEQWDAFLSALVSGKPGSKVLSIAPCPHTKPGPAFRLLGGLEAVPG